MTRAYRLTLSLLAAAILCAVSYSVAGTFAFLGQFWFASGLLLLVLLSLIDQPHFSKDANVFINAATAAMSLLLVSPTEHDRLFWVFSIGTAYLLFSSYVLLWLRNSSLSEERPLIRVLSRINREIGKPETIFSAFFLWGAFKQFGPNESGFNALFLFWVVFMILNVPSVGKTVGELFASKRKPQTDTVIGQIFGVQSKNTFLVKLFDPSIRKRSVRHFDCVQFRYSDEDHARHGLVIDMYLLDQEQWAKVLCAPEIEAVFRTEASRTLTSSDLVYFVDAVPENELAERFVGVVTDGSRIGAIRFLYNAKVPVEEGRLLQVDVRGEKVLYQIAEGTTRIEVLEQKNQTGLIVGEAFQLGAWNPETCRFEKFGWVPEVNTPVFVSRDIEEPAPQQDEYIVGRVPGTNFPVSINKSLAMSHHMAVLGVTGTGKSVFTRNLIRQFLAADDTKCICIDFTGEYAGKFDDVGARLAIPTDVSAELFKKIDAVERGMADNYGKDTDATRDAKKEISNETFNHLKSFLESNDKLAIFELPDVENTSGVLTYTKTFFRILFHTAKRHQNFGRRVCLVLEEAHTIVPEWNFSGVSDRVSQPLLNSIAQIALQGRKYNVGLLVVAQRTANVSKTILTQCNSVVAFQEFDRTSMEFLSNYFGDEVVSVLPRLKARHAVAAGKAFRSNVPMIFQVPDLQA